MKLLPSLIALANVAFPPSQQGVGARAVNAFNPFTNPDYLNTFPNQLNGMDDFVHPPFALFSLVPIPASVRHPPPAFPHTLPSLNPLPLPNFPKGIGASPPEALLLSHRLEFRTSTASSGHPTMEVRPSHGTFGSRIQPRTTRHRRSFPNTLFKMVRTLLWGGAGSPRLWDGVWRV